jgi:hypothetical protein
MDHEGSLSNLAKKLDYIKNNPGTTQLLFSLCIGITGFTWTSLYKKLRYILI